MRKKVRARAGPVHLLELRRALAVLGALVVHAPAAHVHARKRGTKEEEEHCTLCVSGSLGFVWVGGGGGGRTGCADYGEERGDWEAGGSGAGRGLLRGRFVALLRGGGSAVCG